MSLLTLIRKEFSNVAAPIVIPSPLDVIIQSAALSVVFKNACVEHVRQVRLEQEAFQQRIQAVGIERLMKLTPRETREMYG
jgi:hypothetical protein